MTHGSSGAYQQAARPVASPLPGALPSALAVAAALGSAVAPMRCFFAVPLAPGPLREALARLSLSLSDPALRLIPEQNLHLTLCFLGEIPAASVAELRLATAAALERQHAFSCPLTGPVLFPSRRRPRVLACTVPAHAALTDLAHAVRSAAEACGLALESRPGRWHLSLARVRRRQVPQQLAAPTPLPDLQVAELVLFRSELSPAGAQYHRLETWELCPAPG